MEIGGIDLHVNHDKAATAAIIGRHWSKMWYQGVDDNAAIPYTAGRDLPEEFFLYRDEDASRRSDEGKDDDCFEGMIFIISRDSEGPGTWIVYDYPTPPDVQQIVNNLTS